MVRTPCTCHALQPPLYFFFFNDTATTEIYTLSLHDALPICGSRSSPRRRVGRASPGRADRRRRAPSGRAPGAGTAGPRSEEHTSELQSQSNLVCRLLLEKKKKQHVQSQTINLPTQLEHLIQS